MGSSLLKGTFVGGLITWLWTIFSWTMLPWHCDLIQEFNNETEVSEMIMSNTAHSGIYLLPDICNRRNLSLPSDDFQKGPVLFASIRRNGFDLGTPIPYIVSFFIQCVGGFFVTLILLQARVLAYGSKVLMTFFIGLTSGILGYLPSWNWWGFPFPFIFIEMCDLAIAWLIAGLIIAAFIRPTQKRAPPKTDHFPKNESRTLFDN